MTIKRILIPTFLVLLLTFINIMPIFAAESPENSISVEQSYTDSEISNPEYTPDVPLDEATVQEAQNFYETASADAQGDPASATAGDNMSTSSESTHVNNAVSDSSETSEESFSDVSEESTKNASKDLSESTETIDNSASLPDLSVELAEEETEANEAVVGAAVYSYINVTWSEFGANGSDNADDTQALSNALYAAATSASQTNKTVEVYVPAGTYYIKDVLHIYSNTWLHLDSKATITRTNIAKEMLAGAHRDKNNNICYWNCTHTGYTQVVNAKVSGGRWNGGVSSNNCSGSIYSRDILTFRHCSYITIADTIIGDDCSMHSVNIDGVKNLTVSNVTFQNHYRYTGSEKSYYSGQVVTTSTDKNYWTREALHIDEINYDNYSAAYPLEVLPSLNITVTGCTFRNVLSGVGTHNYSKSNPCVNVTIQGNTFNTVYYDCIHAFNFKDMTVKYNKAYNTTGFIYGKDCGGKNKEYSYIQNNTIECSTLNGYPVRDTMYFVGASKIFIEANTFRNIQASGIVIDDGASSKTDTVYSDAVINLNLMENAAGKANGNTNYAAIKAGRGCRISAWKNTVYLQEHTKASYETYGVLLNYAAKGSSLSKNLISGGNIAVYILETKNTSLYSNDIRRAKKAGTYVLRSYETEMTGNLIVSNTGCGLKVENSSITGAWRNAALWNGDKDLIILYSSPFYGLDSFCANTCTSTNKSQTTFKYVEGDVNFDGKLSVLDLQLLSKYVSNPDSALKSEFYMADIDHNGSLTNQDITVMSRRIVN